MRQREENARKAQIFDDFSDYVIKKMRDRDNPNLTVREFSLMPRASMTHMELILENVQTGNERLFSTVKAFLPGSYLKTKEVLKDGSQMYVAFIPYTEDQRKQERGVAYSSSSPPSQTRLMLYMFGFMVLVVLSSLYTTLPEWNYILGRK
jgi:hypothetical protein